MRLDKFLKVSRLIKRRTVANEVSEKGRVLVNGTQAKPAKILKVGDKIRIESSKKPIEVEVLIIPTGNVSIQESSTLYKVLEGEN
ncbi:MAG: RNA-binding S4 domain-containing protein [bacterium]|nr:RNA-binding S4 domain-containing protein [bacterium]